MNKICKNCEWGIWDYEKWFFAGNQCKVCRAGTNFRPRTSQVVPKFVTSKEWEERHVER